MDLYYYCAVNLPLFAIFYIYMEVHVGLNLPY